MNLIYIAIVLTGLATAVLCENHNQTSWAVYKKYFKKNFSAEEDTRRYEIWSKNVERIVQHNFEEHLGLHSFRMGWNQLTDMSRGEYIDKMTHRVKVNRTNDISNPRFPSEWARYAAGQIPDEIDWRTKGVVSPVHDQGQCGSPSMRAALDCLQSQNAIQTKQLVELSGQQLNECCNGTLCDSCTGDFSLPEDYYKCVKRIGGLDYESCYNSTQCSGCNFDPKCIALKVQGYAEIEKSNEDALKTAVALIGPISVGIDASSFSFQLYAGGIFNEPSCSTEMLDHMLLIVGYGSQNGQDYWLAKNSWGTSWGMDGYIMMSRNKNNQCGIATMASYPII